jgi:hypothetical protein
VNPLDDPLVQSAAIPLVAALVLALVIARVAGAWLAAASVPIAWATAHAVMLGAPSLWPRSNDQRLWWLAGIGLAVGVVAQLALHRAAPPRRAALSVVVAGLAAAAAAAWIAWTGLRVGTVGWGESLVVVLAAAFAVASLARAAGRDLDAPLALLVAALAAAPIALFGGSAKLAQLCGAAAAATGGLLLLNWPRVRHPFGLIGVCGIGLPLAGTGAVAALYVPDVSHAALGLVALACATSELAHRSGALERLPGPFWNRLAFLAACAIPAISGAAVAYALFPGESPY